MSTTIRRAGNSDADLLHDLAARTFGLACPPGTPQSDVDAFIAANLSVKAFASYLADPGRVLLIVEADGAPAGYSMLVKGPITDPEVAAVIDERTSVELSKFYLLPDRHGSGAAATLMAATIEAATATGAAFCWLGVNQQNVRAGRFYEKNGFATAGTKHFTVGEMLHDDYILRRPLP